MLALASEMHLIRAVASGKWRVTRWQVASGKWQVTRQAVGLLLPLLSAFCLLPTAYCLLPSAHCSPQNPTAQASQQSAQPAPPSSPSSRPAIIDPKAQELLDKVIQALGGPAFLHFKTMTTHGRAFSISNEEMTGLAPYDSFVE